eukprot:EG_transcript_20409
MAVAGPRLLRWRQWNELAVELNRQRVLRRAFQLWRWRCWRGWVMALLAQQCSGAMAFKALLAAAQAFLQRVRWRCWAHWRRVGHARQLERAALHFQHTASERCLRGSWQHWRRQALLAAQRMAEAVAAADAHHRLHLQAAALAAWQRYIAQRAARRAAVAGQVRSAKRQLRRLTLQATFRRWGAACRARQAAAVADEQCERWALRGGWQRWRAAVRRAGQQATGLAVARGFRFRTVLRDCFRWWRSRWQRRILSGQLTSCAILHYCLALERRVLAGWLQYVDWRRSKHVGEEEALRRRTVRLLR